MSALLASLCLDGAALGAQARIEGRDDGAVREIAFDWGAAGSLEARIEGGDLRLGFSVPLDADVSNLAAAFGDYSRFLQVSPDGRSVRVKLARAAEVRTDNNGRRSLIRLGAPGTLGAEEVAPAKGEAALPSQEVAPASPPVTAPSTVPEAAPATIEATAEAPEAVAPAPTVAPAEGLVVPVVRQGEKGAEILLPLGAAEPIAATRRGERLWIALASQRDVDVGPLEGLRSVGVQGADVHGAEGATVLGLVLAPHVLATLVPEAAGWRLLLGNQIERPTPDLAMERRPGDGGGEVRFALSGTPKLARFKDPEIGDDLLFVMVPAPGQGFISARRFVEMEFLSALQGAVVRPLADDIRVDLSEGLAVLSRERGLALSGANARAMAQKSRAANRQSPAFLDFPAWRGDESKSFDERHAAHLKAVSETDEAARSAAYLDLARFLLAHDLAEEAIGVLAIISSEEPAATTGEAYRILAGAAQLRAGRTAAAKRLLEAANASDDPHALLWQALSAAASEDWSTARLRYEEAGAAIASYEPIWQMRHRVAAARAALEVNDIAKAREHLTLMPRDAGDADLTAQAALIEGEVAAGIGDFDRAARIFGGLENGTNERVGARAALENIRLGLETGVLEPEDGIDKLEALRFRWRGDSLEQEALLTLGGLYARLGDFRHALATMRLVVRYYPGTPLQRAATREMQALFEDLFLKGRADEMPPVQALGLYYDYRELTPVGLKGDTMIRRLADRLVALDLLDQAIELLEYQVDKRLRGIAKSQVAVKLSLLQLSNRQPEEAFRTIQETRLGRLPESLAAQRRLVEARALMDMGRHEHALEVIAADKTAQADRLRAEIHWKAEDWLKAGAAYEAGLAGAWQGEAALGETARTDLMRAAVAYNLAGDLGALERLKAQYTTKMANTPDGSAFAIVTEDNAERPVQFRALAEKIAAIETLEAFMADLKAGDAPLPEDGEGTLN